MTDTPFLDHRAIKRLAESSPKIASILARREIIEAIEPITMAEVGDDAPWETKGFFATIDGRMALRFVTDEEARELFGTEALTAAEAIYLIDRLANIGAIEQAGIDAQARAVRLFAAAERMFDAISNGKELAAKERVRIGGLIHDIRKENEARAAAVAAMRESAAQAQRDRKYVMRKLGVA